MIKSAAFYLQNKISVIPTGDNKRSLIPWKQYQTELPAKPSEMFAHEKCKGIAVICGAVSGNIEVIDVDLKNDVTGTLWEELKAEIGELTQSLYIVRTKSGGYHLYYKCESIEGNLKLASRPATTDEHAANPHVKQVVLIETRGEGGYVIAPPTEGYTKESEFNIPIISVEQREHILTACRSFDQLTEEIRIDTRKADVTNFAKTPWDDYNERADTIALLEKHGWKVTGRKAERTILLRPGVTDSKSSADFHHGLNLFKVFTTSTVFEPGKGYKPFALYSVLEHGGNFSEAAKELIKKGYGEEAASVEKKLSQRVNRSLSAGHSREKIVDVLMHEHSKGKREAELIIEDVLAQRGETILSFWDVQETKNGNQISIHRHKLINFLFESGFHLFFYDQKSNIFRLVYESEGFVSEATTEMVKKFVKSYIQNLPPKFDNITPNDLLEIVMKGSDAYFGNSLIEFLDKKDINLLKDDSEAAYFPFRNGIVRVDANGPKLITYGEIGKVVWKSQVIDFAIDVDFDFSEDLCEFWRFLAMVAGQDQEGSEYLLSLVGYLLHKFKDPAKPFAVILAEETEDEKNGGGTGKGILVKALSYMSNIERVDGKNFKLDKNFAFQRVGLDTRIIAIEDVRKNVDFEGFYSIITEGVTVEKKNKDELFIPYVDSPKILFTTNYTIPSTGNHAKRRQRVFEFSNAFSSSYTPMDHFGHKLFDDWDTDEWNRFYNLMFIAVAFYLKNGVKEVKMGEKLKRKHIRLNFGEEFLEYMDANEDWLKSNFKPFKALYNDFTVANDFDKKDFSQKKFKRGLEEFAEKFGMVLENRRNGTERVLEYKFSEKDMSGT